MLKIENITVYGFEEAIRGMRNPKNSWDKIDSGWTAEMERETVAPGVTLLHLPESTEFKVGPNDHALMMTLAKGGPVHGKFRRMIIVYADITAPLYWWKEFDTYKVGTVANSCSTMHKIHAKEFVPEDFSYEQLLGNPDPLAYPFGNDSRGLTDFDVLMVVMEALNTARKRFLETGDKRYWWQMIQLLPTSYNQKRTVMFSYEVAANIYQYRHNHKLDEWHTLCDAIKDLPYSELITCNTEAD